MFFNSQSENQQSNDYTFHNSRNSVNNPKNISSPTFKKRRTMIVNQVPKVSNHRHSNAVSITSSPDVKLPIKEVTKSQRNALRSNTDKWM